MSNENSDEYVSDESDNNSAASEEELDMPVMPSTSCHTLAYQFEPLDYGDTKIMPENNQTLEQIMRTAFRHYLAILIGAFVRIVGRWKLKTTVFVARKKFLQTISPMRG